VKYGGGAMLCSANNTSYNYNGGTGQRYAIIGIYAPSGARHVGRLEYIMVLDKDPSDDKGKIFCQTNAQDYTAVKVCESMGGKKVSVGLYQL
jgi:hypothetical protein